MYIYIYVFALKHICTYAMCMWSGVRMHMCACVHE